MTHPLIAKTLWQARRGWCQAGAVGLAGLALVLAGVALYGSVVQRSHARLLELRQASANLHERLDRAAGSFNDRARTPEEQLTDFYGSFPPMQAAPELLRKIYRAAERRGLVLSQGEYKAVRERTGMLTRYQVVLPVKGPYLPVREFLTSVMREIPFIALDNVSFQRERIGEGAVEAKIHLTLYIVEGS